MKILNVIRHFYHLAMMNRIKKYAELSSDSYYSDIFGVEIRDTSISRKYMKVGHHCVLDGKFFFETSEGFISIGDRVHIGNSSFISREMIEIENDVTIAWGCLIYDHNSHSVNWNERKNDTEREYENICNRLNPIENKNWDVVKSAPIHICPKVWIGANCTILKGVTIGEGSIVAAGSVVTKDVEPWVVVGGNPATVIRKLK